MDKRPDKTTVILIITGCVTWIAAIALLICFLHSVNRPVKNIEESVTRIEQSLEEATEVAAIRERMQQEKLEALAYERKTQRRLLVQSVEICKNEYAEDIAKSVLTEHYRTGAPIYALYALIGTECDNTKTNQISVENSGYFNPKARSSANCIGVTQTGRSAMEDFNTFSGHANTYKWEEMYDIHKNIEVGAWHYMRYRSYVGDDWVALYIIYNVGWTRYSAKNNYWIYNNSTEKWERHDNAWYFRNGKYPPTTVNLSFNQLEGYAPTRRFTTYLEMYSEMFN